MDGWTRWSARIGLAGITVFIFDLLALHIWSLSTGHVPEYVSHYGRGAEGWLWTKGLVALGIGILGFGLALPAAMEKTGWRLASRVLLVFVLVGVGLIAGFKTNVGGEPSTTEGQIHMSAVIPTFLAITLAMVVMGFAFWKDPRWQGLAATSWGLATLSVISTMAFAESHYNGTLEVSVTERMVVFAAVAWFLVIAKKLTTVLGELSLVSQTSGASQRASTGPEV